MGKNPLNTIKKTINNAGETVSKTYTNVSKNVAETASKIIPPNLIRTEDETVKINNEPIKKIITEVEQEIKPELSPFEKKIQSLYVGCFSDDPTNPSMEKDLGDVSNSLECIELGKKHNYKYIGVQQGNRCFASNKIPIATEVNRHEYCNIGCDDINTGNCGGFFYNQVYKTDINDNALNILNEHVKNDKNQNNKNNEKKNEKEASDMLEKFLNLDTDIEKINYGLSYVNYNCLSPINTYHLFIWFIVLIILLYLLFEYLYKQKSEKIV
jgi:hypothetical protein